MISCWERSKLSNLLKLSVVTNRYKIFLIHRFICIKMCVGGGESSSPECGPGFKKMLYLYKPNTSSAE